KDLGYLPEAMFNFITLLGWSPGGEEEIFTQDQLIEIFDPVRLSTSAAVFDAKKLEWMNGEYIKHISVQEVIDLALPHLIKAVGKDINYEEAENDSDEDVNSLNKEQLHYRKEIVEITDLIFNKKNKFDEAAEVV